jgi:hypothetical protein
MVMLRTFTKRRELGTVPMTYGDVKLKPLTYVDKSCLRMTIQESKHAARGNGNKGYSYVDKMFVVSVCL